VPKFKCMEIFEDTEYPLINLWIKATDLSWALARNDLLAGYKRRISCNGVDRFIAFSGRHLRRRPDFASYSWADWIGGVGSSLKTTNRGL